MPVQIKLIQILCCLLHTGWIKTRPAEKLLVRVKFTGNPCSYETRINVNGRHWNTCELVFLGTHISVLGLALVSMWTQPETVCLCVRNARGQGALRDLLNPLVTRVVDDSSLQINTNPVEVYKQWVNQTEAETGQTRSARPHFYHYVIK